MKKYTPFSSVLIICLLICVFQLKAQTLIVPQVGLTLSKIVSQDGGTQFTEKIYDEQFDYLNVAYGLEVIQQLNQRTTLNLLIDYKKGGSDSKGVCCNDDGGLYWVKLNYLGFNPQIEYTVFQKLHCGLGIYSNILLKANWKVNSFGGPVIIDFKDGYSNFDTGLSAGVGYTIFEKLLVNLNYQHGIKKVIDTDQNRWLQLSLGYIFRI